MVSWDLLSDGDWALGPSDQQLLHHVDFCRQFSPTLWSQFWHVLSYDMYIYEYTHIYIYIFIYIYIHIFIYIYIHICIQTSPSIILSIYFTMYIYVLCIIHLHTHCVQYIQRIPRSFLGRNSTSRAFGPEMKRCRKPGSATVQSTRCSTNWKYPRGFWESRGFVDSSLTVRKRTSTNTGESTNRPIYGIVRRSQNPTHKQPGMLSSVVISFQSYKNSEFQLGNWGYSLASPGEPCFDRWMASFLAILRGFHLLPLKDIQRRPFRERCFNMKAIWIPGILVNMFKIAMKLSECAFFYGQLLTHGQ